MQGQKSSIVLFLIFILVVALIVGCNQETDKELGKDNMVAQGGESEKSFSVLFDLDQIIEMEPIKIGLINVGVISNTLYKKGSEDQRGHLALGLEIGNISDELIWVFTEQCEITLISGEILKVDANISSDVGGSFPPHRLKKGFLLFPINETDPDEIKELTLKIKSPLGSGQTPLGEDLEVPIKLE